QKERDVIQKLDRDLAIHPKNGAVDVNLLARLQADVHPALHRSPSEMVEVISIKPLKFVDFSSRISSASRRIQRPIEMRSARSCGGSSFSGLARSSMSMPQSRCTNVKASIASRVPGPASSAIFRSSIDRSIALRSLSRQAALLSSTTSAY